MILAAGRGERLRPWTDSTPKPLLEVRGQALIEYPLRALTAAGIADVVINTAYRGAQIRDRLGDGRRYGLRIRYSEEPEGALDTGGGIRRALTMLGDGPFVVTNADVLTDYDYSRLVERGARMRAGVLAHLVLVPNPDNRAGGDFGLDDDRIDNRTTYTFAGIGLYRAELFAGQADGAFSVVPLLRGAAGRGAVTGEFYRGDWADVGTPERLSLARRGRDRRNAGL